MGCYGAMWLRPALCWWVLTSAWGAGKGAFTLALWDRSNVRAVPFPWGRGGMPLAPPPLHPLIAPCGRGRQTIPTRSALC